MDVASKIKDAKSEINILEEERMILEKRIKELRSLIELKRNQQAKIADLKKLEEDLLKQLG